MSSERFAAESAVLTFETSLEVMMECRWMELSMIPLDTYAWVEKDEDLLVEKALTLFRNNSAKIHRASIAENLFLEVDCIVS